MLLLLLVSSVDLDILCSGSFSHHAKFYSFMFMHKISSRMVCVNCRHPPGFLKKYILEDVFVKKIILYWNYFGTTLANVIR